MSCSCQCPGIEKQFDSRAVEKELRQYHRRGPSKTTRTLIEALRGQGVRGTTLLDIGGGVGAIQHELFKDGISHVTSVDASSAYIRVQAQEAKRLGFVDRIDHHHGDFVELASQIEPADIVTLDRVICCYRAMPELVGLSAARARRLYGLVYPRDTWWNRIGLGVINAVTTLRRSPFRVFLHRTAAVEALLMNHGFRRSFYTRTLLWQVVVYTR